MADCSFIFFVTFIEDLGANTTQKMKIKDSDSGFEDLQHKQRNVECCKVL